MSKTGLLTHPSRIVVLSETVVRNQVSGQWNTIVSKLWKANEIRATLLGIEGQKPGIFLSLNNCSSTYHTRHIPYETKFTVDILGLWMWCLSHTTYLKSEKCSMSDSPFYQSTLLHPFVLLDLWDGSQRTRFVFADRSLTNTKESFLGVLWDFSTCGLLYQCGVWIAPWKGKTRMRMRDHEEWIDDSGWDIVLRFKWDVHRLSSSLPYYILCTTSPFPSITFFTPIIQSKAQEKGSTSSNQFVRPFPPDLNWKHLKQPKHTCLLGRYPISITSDLIQTSFRPHSDLPCFVSPALHFQDYQG